MPAGEVAGAERGRLQNLGTVDLRVQRVSEKLHRPVAGAHAAVDPDNGCEIARPQTSRVRAHRVDEIARLIADAFERGAHDLLARRAAR